METCGRGNRWPGLSFSMGADGVPEYRDRRREEERKRQRNINRDKQKKMEQYVKRREARRD